MSNESSSSHGLEDSEEQWSTETAIAKLSTQQITFLAARLWNPNDKTTAEKIGIRPNTVYSWPKDERSAIRWLLNHYSTNAIQSAQELLTRSLITAAMVKIGGLDSSDLHVKQNAATEIMDRVIGKPRYAFDITTNQPTLKTYVNVSPDMWDDDEPPPSPG